MPGTPPDLSPFGELIEHLRRQISKERRPGVNELGATIGVSRSRWHRVRVGRGDLNRAELQRLASALEVDVSVLANDPSQSQHELTDRGDGSANAADFRSIVSGIVRSLAAGLESNGVGAPAVIVTLGALEQAARIQQTALPTAYWALRRRAHDLSVSPAAESQPGNDLLGAMRRLEMRVHVLRAQGEHGPADEALDELRAVSRVFFGTVTPDAGEADALANALVGTLIRGKSSAVSASSIKAS